MKTKLRDKEQGQALVEFALILPILLLLLFGIVEFGRIYSASLIVKQGAREGARVASLGMTDTEIVTKVQGSALALDIAKLTVYITPALADRKRGQDVQVVVGYSVTVVAPFISAITGPTVNVNGASVMRME